MQRILFFIGKGGVGKSTLSAVTATVLALTNKKTTLISLDPAHNQGDIFQQEFSEKPTAVLPNLHILEMNPEKWIKHYLKKTEEQFSAAYAYLTTFSLEKHFAVIRHAPGVEAYALIMAFEHVLKKNQSADYLIFDMPPTALSLSFFALPGVSLLWLEKLMTLRNEISEKQQLITSLRLGRKTIERDRVMQNIQRQIERWSTLQKLFTNISLKPVVVKNPDVLSRAETERILLRLNELNMEQPLIFNNKSNKTSDADFDFHTAKKLIGADKIHTYCKKTDTDRLLKILEWPL